MYKISKIPHKEQRYNTVGDWVFEGDEIKIMVSDTGDPRMNALVGVHELVEVLLCKDRGISQSDVDKFDMGHPELSDPGSHPDAPYKKEHEFATKVEKMLCDEFGIKWEEYEKILHNL
ncbi:MAG: hypothetical protein PHS95_01180 [Candidatus Pacebacteria bacterium]|nr:hypothetical protein [Candidatus Paceibacterota bacterium]